MQFKRQIQRWVLAWRWDNRVFTFLYLTTYVYIITQVLSCVSPCLSTMSQVRSLTCREQVRDSGVCDLWCSWSQEKGGEGSRTKQGPEPARMKLKLQPDLQGTLEPGKHHRVGPTLRKGTDEPWCCVPPPQSLSVIGHGTQLPGRGCWAHGHFSGKGADVSHWW